MYYSKANSRESFEKKKCMSMSYFGLHPFSPCDELGVTSSFFSQPINESRAGSLPNPKGETPTIQPMSLSTHAELEQLRSEPYK